MTDEDKTATIGDVRRIVNESEQRLTEAMRGMHNDLTGAMRGMHDHLTEAMQRTQTESEHRLVEMMRGMQTELLRGFESFAVGQNIRLLKVEADQSNLDTALSS